MGKCDTEGRKQPTIDLYAGIFNNQLYSRRGARGRANWSGFEGFQEDVLTGLSLDDTSFHDDPSFTPETVSHSDSADEVSDEETSAFCERHRFSQKKSTLKTDVIHGVGLKKQSHVDANDKKCAERDVANVDFSSGGATYSNTQCEHVDDKTNLSFDVRRKFNDKKINVLRGMTTETYSHFDADGLKTTPPSDVMDMKRISQNDVAPLNVGLSTTKKTDILKGGAHPRQESSLQSGFKQSNQRIDDANAAEVHMSPHDNKIPSTPTKLSNGGLFCAHISSPTCLRTTELMTSRISLASFNDANVQERRVDSTSLDCVYVSTLDMKPNGWNALSSSGSNLDSLGPQMQHHMNIVSACDKFDKPLLIKSRKCDENNADHDRNRESGEVKCQRGNESGEQEVIAKGDANGHPWKESSSMGHPHVSSLRIGGRGSLDSSSSYGGSSSSGSPTAFDASKEGRVSSFGNNSISKGSPNSVSSRSTGSNTGSENFGNALLLSSNSNGSPVQYFQSSGARKSSEMVPNRKSAEMVHYGHYGPRNVVTHAANTTCPGNGTKGNNAGNCNGSVNILNSRNLLVGGTNGNVLSYGGGSKLNGKQGVSTKSTLASVDCSLMKRAQASLDPEEMKNAGNEYYRRGHISEALILYDKAVALSPRNASYRSNKAAALSALGRLGEAVKECEEAIRLDPLHVRAHQRVTSLYIRVGLIDKANEQFRAVGQETDQVEVQRLRSIEKHLARCVDARSLGDWHKVVRESDAAVVAGADSAPQIFGLKAEALLMLHKLEDADGVCAAAQRVERSLVSEGICPADPFLLLIRGQIDMALGRFEEAIVAADLATRIDSSNGKATALLRKARAVAQARVSGNDLFKGGRLFEALALYAEGLESDPANAVLLCNRAACRLKLGQWEKAVEDCNAVLRVQPGYTKALLRRATCLTKLERWQDALQDYEILRRDLPEDIEVARGFFDVQVAMKKSRGEETRGMKFGGDVEEIRNDEQFRGAVNSAGLAVVQFITRWSERCRQLSPFMHELCRRHPCVNFVKVDVEDNPYLAQMESVSFIPTFKLYKDGQKVKEILGPSEQSLEYAVKHYSL